MQLVYYSAKKEDQMVTFKGNPVEVAGALPARGSAVPNFKLVNGNLADVCRVDFAGKKVVLNIFPSIDTGVCAASVRRFNEAAAGLKETAVLCVSMDLPFAQARFCGAEGLENVIPLSAFRSPEFGKDYGVLMTSGPLAGLLARAVVVLDETARVVYTELVPEITQEPDYDAVLQAVAAID